MGIFGGFGVWGFDFFFRLGTVVACRIGSMEMEGELRYWFIRIVRRKHVE